MLYFSYNDFIDCVDNGEINEAIKLEEKAAKYELKNKEKKVHNNKNQIIEILREKLQLKKFLKEFFNLFEVGNIDNINFCRNIKAVTDKATNENITYKIENKEIFIFIKVIEKIDNNISYKMFEHSLNIIKNWDKEEKKQNKRYPIVIPIVIYTGKKEWKNSRISKKLKYTTFEDNRINFSYNIVNIHDMSLEQLENMESKVAKKIIELKR